MKYKRRKNVGLRESIGSRLVREGRKTRLRGGRGVTRLSK